MGLRRIALLVLATLTVAVAGTSLIRTVGSFYRLDFPVTWTAHGIHVGQPAPGSSAARAGLVAGDRVVAVDGFVVARLTDPVFVMAAGERHRLKVVGPDGEVREIPYSPPPPDVDPTYLARTAVGLVGLVCAVAAVVVTRRREATTFLLLAATSLIVGAVPHRTAATGEVLQVIHRMAGAALPFLIIRFFAVFPERRQSMLAWDALTVVAVVSAGLSAVRSELEGWWSVGASMLRVLFAVGLLTGVAVHLRRWWLATREARIRRQIEWAALGLFVGLSPYLVLVLLPTWLGVPFEPFSWLAVLPMAAMPLGFLAALTEYRLWDLEPITRESVSATLVVLMGGLIFAVTNHVVLGATQGLSSLRNLFAFATGVLLVVLLAPVRDRVQHFLDRWLHHGRPAPRWLITDSSRDLAEETDPHALLDRLSATVREGLEFELVATYLRRAGGGFRRITGDGSLPEVLDETVVDGEYPTRSESLLAEKGFAVRIPLDRAGTVHGLLYMGLRRGIFPLGTEMREVVGALAAQAAVGLESARYLDDLRRQAEEYRILHANTQRIIESSAAAILVCDAGGRILSANGEAADIFSRGAAALVGQALGELVVLPEGWQGQLPLHADNAESTTRTPESRRVVLAVSVLELESGSFNGRVVVLQDVTEMRDLQDRMREQERLASLGRLASGLAHEINTPLTGIVSFAQMLGEMTGGDDPRSPLVSKLVDQSFRVSRIVSNLHEAVRGSGGDKTVLDLAEVARRAAMDAARSLGDVDRVTFIPPAEKVVVWGSPGPVELAVSNLVRNAIEASPAGVEVSVTVSAEPEWGVVVVQDRGPGVPTELRDKVFQPFFTTKTERGGTGLGLAITRDMISQLGGHVQLDAGAEGGTRAVVRMRRWKASAASS